jgi:hypothetical protein
MKKVLFSFALLSVSLCLQAQTKMPSFAKLGYNKQLLYTSSKGEFEEFHDQTDVVEIGNVFFNTVTKKIVGFVSEDAGISSATTAMTIDPHCERYYWISPYAFCLNNPVRYIDPTGMDTVEVNMNSGAINHTRAKGNDMIYYVDDDGNRQDNPLQFSPNTIQSVKNKKLTYKDKDGNKQTTTHTVIKLRGDGNGEKFFDFLADNFTVANNRPMEFSLFKTGQTGNGGLNFLSTSHLPDTEPGAKDLINGQLINQYYIREFRHNHPFSSYPSGLDNRDLDIGIAGGITDINTYWGYQVPIFSIYYTPTRRLIYYTPNSTRSDF